MFPTLDEASQALLSANHYKIFESVYSKEWKPSAASLHPVCILVNGNALVIHPVNVTTQESKQNKIIRPFFGYGMGV
jgi:hypothetical protein